MLRRPSRRGGHPRAVSQIDADVSGSVFRLTVDRKRSPRDVATDGRQLAKRRAHVSSTADVERPSVHHVEILQLVEHQRQEVVDVQHVAHLLALATETDVAERSAEQMPRDPQGNDALIDLAHLPRSRDHAASVRDGAEPVHLAILDHEQLGAQLRGSVQRARALQREVLGDTAGRCSGHRLIVVELETQRRIMEAQRVDRGGRVDATRRKEQDVRAVSPGELQAVHCAVEVGAHDITRRGRVAGEY